MSESPPGSTTHRVLTDIIRAHPKTQDPVNALVVWTEIGKALAGTIERQGAPLGLLRRIIADHGRGRVDVAAIDLSRWIYRVPAAKRMSQQELAVLMGEISSALATASAGAFETDGGNPDLKSLFLEVVKGWYPVGVEIVQRLPAAANAPASEIVGILTAWCEKYLPLDPTGPADLGVRVDRHG